jgi:hypothetical protein
MSVIVEQQNDTIVAIDGQAAGVEKDTEVGCVSSASSVKLADIL